LGAGSGELHRGRVREPAAGVPHRGGRPRRAHPHPHRDRDRAIVHDLLEPADLVPSDDEVVYADDGYQGVAKQPEIAGEKHLSSVEFRVAAREGELAAMPGLDRRAESRKASRRAKVEHAFLVVKRAFGFTRTRYQGRATNLNHLHVLFASANWLLRARALALLG